MSVLKNAKEVAEGLGRIIDDDVGPNQAPPSQKLTWEEKQELQRQKWEAKKQEEREERKKEQELQQQRWETERQKRKEEHKEKQELQQQKWEEERQARKREREEQQQKWEEERGARKEEYKAKQELQQQKWEEERQTRKKEREETDEKIQQREMLTDKKKKRDTAISTAAQVADKVAECDVFGAVKVAIIAAAQAITRTALLPAATLPNTPEGVLDLYDAQQQQIEQQRQEQVGESHPQC